MGDIVPQVRKIAVLRSNSLGDYIFILPALEALRGSYPGAEIVLLGQRWHAEFLAGRPGPVDRVVVVPHMPAIYHNFHGEDDPHEKIEAFFKDMQREKFDIALQLFGGGRHSNPFVRRLGARVTAGMKDTDAPPLDRWIPYIYYHPEIFRYLEVAALVGARPRDIEPHLAVSKNETEEARRLLGGTIGRIAVLHPGGSDPRRHWPAEKFAAVGDALAKAGAKVVVTGTKEETPLADRVTCLMERQASDLCGKLSLKGLAGLLSLCRVVISNDTGPLHLARATGTATVGIYWIGNLITAGPVTSAQHRSHPSWRLECPVCGRNCIADNCAHTASFVADVPVHDVVRSAMEMLRQGEGREKA